MIVSFAVIMARRSASVHRDLETAHERLLVVDRLKDDFLANTSHELRTPLHGIINITEAILKKPDKFGINDEGKRSLSLVAASGRRLSSLVNDILDFERIRKNMLKLEIRPVDVRSIADSVIRFARYLVQERPLELINSVAKDLPLVEADEERLEQVLLNLVGNAVKFTESGSVEILADTNGSIVTIHVRDSGTGIPPEKQDLVFESFEQLDSSTSRRHGGAGLGLPISRSLVRLMGGDLTLRSEVGKGSTFSFSLPLYEGLVDASAKGVAEHGDLSAGGAEDPAHLAEAARLISESAAAGMARPVRPNPSEAGEPFRGPIRTFLLVDDDEINLHTMQSMLSDPGFHKIPVRSGEEALRILEHDWERIDVVLLDVMMPRVTGYDVLKRIREDKRMQHIPVILVTAKNRREDMIEGLALGANDFLSKPVEAEELRIRVENMLTLVDSFRLRAEIADYEKELQVARAVQSTVLTSPDDLNRLDFLEMEVRYLPMNGMVGGDYYHVSSIDGAGGSLMIADAAGHGVHAALAAMQMDIANRVYMEGNPHERIESLNRIFMNHSQVKNFFTGFVMDVREGFVHYSSAGHPVQYLVRHKNGEVVKLKNSGVPIGVYPYSKYTTMREPAVPGDLFFLYTDGLTENLADGKVEIEDELLYETLVSLGREGVFRMGLHDVLDRILHSVRPDLAMGPAQDDITLIAFRLKN